MAKTNTIKMDRQIPQNEIRRRKLIKGLRVGLPTVAVLGLGYWLLASMTSTEVRRSQLRFSQVERGDIEVSVSASGQVAAAFEEVINSPISSRVIEVCHRAGDVVEAGTPLLVLDLHAARVQAEKQSDQLRMKRLELERQLVGDNTALGAIEMQIKVGEMKVERLRAEYANERYLDSIGSGTTDKVREAAFALRSAELELEQLSRQLSDERASRRAAADVTRLEIEIMAKEADMAARTLGEAEIRAPRRATITQISDRIGSQVSQGEVVATIADLGHYKITAEATDAYAASIETGNPAKVRIGTLTLDGIVSTVTPTSTSGVISFTVSLDNDSIDRLRPGLRSDVYVSNGMASDVLRIANGQYYSKPGKYRLFVLSADGTRLERRDVELGVASMDHVQVISGLNAGEKVVVVPLGALEEKETLEIDG